MRWRHLPLYGGGFWKVYHVTCHSVVPDAPAHWAAADNAASKSADSAPDGSPPIEGLVGSFSLIFGSFSLNPPGNLGGLGALGIVTFAKRSTLKPFRRIEMSGSHKSDQTEVPHAS